MKKTLKRNWQRVRMQNGALYYWTYVSEYIITQVWRDGSFWRWAIVGFALNDRGERQPFMWRQGTGGTMNEACFYCESNLDEGLAENEQLLMVLP